MKLGGKLASSPSRNSLGRLAVLVVASISMILSVGCGRGRLNLPKRQVKDIVPFIGVRVETAHWQNTAKPSMVIHGSIINSSPYSDVIEVDFASLVPIVVDCRERKFWLEPVESYPRDSRHIASLQSIAFRMVCRPYRSDFFENVFESGGEKLTFQIPVAVPNSSDRVLVFRQTGPLVAEGSENSSEAK